ncbi:MAG: hypothetical protein R2867_26560 [Caldilineaceae bacterium]
MPPLPCTPQAPTPVMNITGVTGISEAQKAVLRALGAGRKRREASTIRHRTGGLRLGLYHLHKLVLAAANGNHPHIANGIALP